MVRQWILGCLVLCLCLPSFSAEQDGGFLFTSFRDNGQDGLYLAYSYDGLHWTALKDDTPFLAPKVGRDKLMRDPCAIAGPDGEFHMVWTVSWKEQGIGIAHTNDFIHWTEQHYIPVMEHEPDAKNCWAPEIFYDDIHEQYVIFWATTILNRFPETLENNRPDLNHRMYYTTTRDFKTYTKTQLFYEPGFSVIDSTIVKRGEKDYVMVLKDETANPPQKNLKLAFASSPVGPWSEASAPITQTEAFWAEGPTAIQIDEYWYVYFDKYTKHRYGAIRSKDLKQWEEVSDQLRYPKGMRHGSVLAVSADVIKALQQVKKN
jgi:hypothetical protein